MTCIVGLYSALTALRASAASTDANTQASNYAAQEYMFLNLFTTSGSSIPSIVSFLAFLGPLGGVLLGFDAVNRERSHGTLNRLVSQPIYRDSVIAGKFLGAFTVVCITVFSIGFLICGAGIFSTGIVPGGEEIARIIAFLLLTCFYIGFWLALAIFFSVVCRHTATSALACIAIWIFLSFFMTMLAGALAGAVYPTSGANAMTNTLSNYKMTLTLDRLSPYYLFSEAISTILNPNVRAIGIVTQSQLSGAVVGYLSFGQSLLLVWPHLVCLVALTAICFGIGYVCFMRQEIRA